MNTLPNFTSHGYDVQRILGQTRSHGRVTYLARRIDADMENVVIKQFSFGSGSHWEDYSSHQREIDVLKHLSHPCIPKYLDSFGITDGFCLVQEYKDAPSLAEAGSLSPEEVRQVGLAVLRILVDLQQHQPPVIHRDLKPENILLKRIPSGEMQVYLVDFGFARIGGGEVGASSTVKGTLGFMPPEQLFNRQLTPASDLYGLGLTLICLLLNLPSQEVSQIISEDLKVNFRPRIKHLHPSFCDWLDRMTAPRLADRFPNAEVALQKLGSIDQVSDRGLSKAYLRWGMGGTGVAALLFMSFWLMKSNDFNDLPITSSDNVTIIPNGSAVDCPSDPDDTEAMDAFLDKYFTPLSTGQSDLPPEVLRKRLEDCMTQVSGEPFHIPPPLILNERQDIVQRREFNVDRLRYERLCPNCDLTRMDLQGMTLVRADLSGSNLSTANLTQTLLREANLQGANLTGAELVETDLSGANLSQAVLVRANLEGVNFAGADLQGSYFDGANLSEVNFSGADLRGASLGNADITGSTFTGAQLDGATLPQGFDQGS